MEAEFILDLLYSPNFEQHFPLLGKTYSDIQEPLSEALKIVEDLGYKGLHAKALKFKGLLYFKKYLQDYKRSNDNHSVASSFKSKERPQNTVVAVENTEEDY